MNKKTIFIFRRDFRLTDNIGLIRALNFLGHDSDLKKSNSKTVNSQVLPIFIFTPEQVKNNKYKSDNAIQFMMQALQDLDLQLRKCGSKLFYFFGDPESVIEDLISKDLIGDSGVQKNKIDAVFVNTDYTPYSIKRDEKISKVCKKHGVFFESCHDSLLQPAGAVLTGANTPFLKYTPFFNKSVKIKVDAPCENNYKNYYSKNSKINSKFILETTLDDAKFGPEKFLQKFLIKDFIKNKNIAINGGRQEALKILSKTTQFKDYDKNRNFLEYQTTKLSAYIKFGCISIREVYAAFKKIGSRDLIRQLYWRDFYYNILHSNPRVLGHALKEKYDNIVWLDNKILLKKWQNAETGFPIVDACMRELNQTGFMHNRGRLIVSNFLVKILLIDWREGEKYFANKLVDYDVAVNNGNWQWSAGTGADSQPYFRIFNPWMQSKKFDKNCEYIKKWLPELKSVKPADTHNWASKCKEYKNINYPAPIVNYSQARKNALAVYKKYLSA